jgi:signal transduction histidine kinase
VLDPDRTYLTDFITVGIDEGRASMIGNLPMGHGILGLLIAEPKPLRLPDLNEHPDSFGFPPNHPPMTSFLGVPVIVGSTVYGNLYLTDKGGGEVFTDIDEELVIALAAAAATAIEKARLHERVQQFIVVEDRERIARDLHDTVIQRLFATGLSLQGAIRLSEKPEVISRVQQAIDELDMVVREIRTSIFELQAAQVSSTGLRRELLGLGDELAEALGYAPAIRFEGPIDTAVSDDLAPHLLAVVRESLTNVARHARSPSATVSVEVADGRRTAVVDDEGDGLGPRRDGGNGLGNIERRADGLGGTCSIGPRDGGGTRVHWEVPL